MRFHGYCGVLALVAVVAALADRTAAVSSEPTSEPARTAWGNENAGLRCRLAAPDRLEQGMPLAADIELGCVPGRLPPGITKLNRFLADASLELILLDPHGKTTFTVRPYDPTFGMPVQDTGRQTEPLQPAGAPLQPRFPLANVWSVLKPGVYEARVRYSFPGGYQKSWWRGTPAEWNAIWKGAVVSAPVKLQILPATPKTEMLALPKRLRLLPGLKIGYSKDDAEMVDAPRRNGFALGTSIARGEGRGYSLQGGTPKPNDVNPIDQLLDYRGGKMKLSYTITVFETADRAGHMWHPNPGSGNYRELWRQTFDLTLSEKELKDSASAAPPATPAR